MRTIPSVLLILVALSFSYNAKASHCAGGELTYVWLHDSTYKFTVKFYRDCNGIDEEPTVQLCYYNSCNADGGTLHLPKRTAPLPDGRPNGSEIETGCPGFPTSCVSHGSAIPSYREWWYEDELTLPSKCNSWLFYISINARNASVNITGVTGNFYLEATLNNFDAPTNSSPAFSVKPVPYVCINQAYAYNNGVYDADGDSLVFESMMPQTQGGGAVSPCTKPSGNTSLFFSSKTPVLNVVTNPFQTNNTFSLNTITGGIYFTPAELGAQTITLRAKEYRNGKLIGSIMRDVQIQVMNCSLSPLNIEPVAATFLHAVYNKPNIDVCKGQPFSFCFDVKAAVKGTVLIVSDNHTYSIPGASINYTNQRTDSIRGCISWTPPTSDTGIKPLTITVKDSSCHSPGVAVTQTFTLPLHFTAFPTPPGAVSPVYRCHNANSDPLTATGPDLLWYNTFTGGIGNPTPPSPSTASVGSTIFYVASGPAGCQSPRTPVEAIVSAVLNAKIIAPDSICQYVYTGLSNYSTHMPGFLYSWSLDTGTVKSRDTTGAVIVNWNTPGLKKIMLTTSNTICQSYDTAYLFVMPRAVAAFDLKETGCVDQEITLTPKQTLPSSYHWSITEQIIKDTVYVPQYKFKWHTTGLKTITLHITSDNGCSPPADTQTIYINENPPVHITLATDRICLGEELTLSTVKGADYIYGWAPAEYFNNNNYYEATMNVERSTKVSVSVSNRWGCIGADSIDLVAGLCCKIFMPDAFSPNGDGHNDVYHAVGIESHTIRSFMITNRWGQTIFSTTDPLEGWNGNFKHTPQPTDTYFYYIKYTCDDGNTFEKKGSFALLR